MSGMNRFWPISLWCATCVGLLGCSLHGPLKMHAKVVQELHSPVDSSPVVAMPVGMPREGAARVALIDIDGMLANRNRVGLMSWGTNPVADFRAKLDFARCRNDVCAVVIRIHSPGGTVTACDMMWNDLNRFKEETGLPVIVCLMDVAASGAYYIATAGDWIVAHPMSITGGIGVIFNYYDMQTFLSATNLVSVPVKSGSNVDMGSPIREMPDSTRELIESMAGDYQSRFHDRIRESRGIEVSDDIPFADGRILCADEALSVGLVDSIGYLEDAIELAANQAGKSKPQTLVLHRRRDRADTPYAITPANPIQKGMFPIDIPGIQREELSMFLYLWQGNSSYAK